MSEKPKGKLYESLIVENGDGERSESYIEMVLDEAKADYPSTSDERFFDPYYTVPVIDWEKLTRARYEWFTKWFGVTP